MKKTILMMAAFAAMCSATPVAYNAAVTCKEFIPNTYTGTLSVMLDASAGTLTAGSQAADNCYFNLAGSIAAASRVNGAYNLTSPLDAVCWHTGGFCVFGPQLVTLAIEDAPGGGQSFTIVSASITTTFTLPASAAVPEPGMLAMLGLGLVAVSRWR